MINDYFRSFCHYLYIGKEHKDPKSVQYFRYTTNASPVLQKHSMVDLPSRPSGYIRIVVVGDTHTKHAKIQQMIPECDLFIHCGDIIMKGRTLSVEYQKKQLKRYNDWIKTVKCRHALVLGGNHDLLLEKLGKENAKSLLSNAQYLENDHFTIGNVLLWGSPVSHGHSRNKAFQSKEFVQSSLDTAPTATDILITHGHHEQMQRKVQHRVHLCGHNHNGYGIEKTSNLPNGNPVYSICAPICDGHFQLAHLPIVLDFPDGFDNEAKLSYLPVNETASYLTAYQSQLQHLIKCHVEQLFLFKLVFHIS